MKDSVYHKSLRVSALTLAVVLAFQSGIFSPVTKQLSNDTGVYLANVIGVGASIEPTELNTLTAELTKARQELAARDAQSASRDIDINFGAYGDGSDKATYILSAILFVLLCLIILNYVLDFMRYKRRSYSQ